MSTKKELDESKAEVNDKKCGIIMPISDSASYPSGHWREVLSIIEEAFAETEFTPSLVSKKDSIGLIHESIVTNIYSNEIVVCDVSTKNPNVMFELGMRLAFDKPVIIIKDEKTDYSFDTGPIEHLSYPSSLRFQDIVIFKKELKNRALATYEHAKAPNFSPYLKSFNKAIVPAKIENVEVTDIQFIVDSVKNLISDVDRLTNAVEKREHKDFARAQASKVYRTKSSILFDDLVLEVAETLKRIPKEELRNTSIEYITSKVIKELPKIYLEEIPKNIIINTISDAATAVLGLPKISSTQFG